MLQKCEEKLAGKFMPEVEDERKREGSDWIIESHKKIQLW